MAFQTREVIEALQADSGVQLTSLRVDGGMVENELLMLFQAGIRGIPLERPIVRETTSLEAAFAAGLAVGYWDGPDEISRLWSLDRAWAPSMAESRRSELYTRWHSAVERTLDWA